MNELEIPYELRKEYMDSGIDLIEYLPVVGVVAFYDIPFDYYLHDGCYFRLEK